MLSSSGIQQIESVSGRRHRRGLKSGPNLGRDELGQDGGQADEDQRHRGRNFRCSGDGQHLLDVVPAAAVRPSRDLEQVADELVEVQHLHMLVQSEALLEVWKKV